MLITSRSAAEYAAMFALTSDDLAGSVLDCCAGGSSFAAETGPQVLAVDPAYVLGRAELARSVHVGLGSGDRIIAEHDDRFDWDWYGTAARRTQMRRTAAEQFLRDLDEQPGHYVAGALPHLPLADASVDLVLCSHLLFTWSDRLDVEWHRRALAELVRVARREVRVFPLVVQGSGAPVPFLDELRADIEAAGRRTELRAVTYRFQRGADHMLCVT